MGNLINKDVAGETEPSCNASNENISNDMPSIEKQEKKQESTADTIQDETMKLHWNEKAERRGLGNLIHKANHIAIVVSDVGKSLTFYSDILGFQQILRPNFDRHGAWLTMGNIELHLIKGKPVVFSGDDLIVGHISLETFHIDKVLDKLNEMGIKFRLNVSVPNSKEDGVVTQYFFTDPDGYYVELCNCDILTKFCLGEHQYDSFQYDEGVQPHIDIPSLARAVSWAEHAKSVTSTPPNHRRNPAETKKANEVDVIVDEIKLENLLKRTKVYGDIIQGETEESLRSLLKSTNNDVPQLISKLQENKSGKQVYIPPAFYDQGETLHTPPSFEM